MGTASKFPIIAKRLTGGSHLGPRSLELRSERDRALQPQSTCSQAAATAQAKQGEDPRNHADYDHSPVTKH